MRAFLIRWYFRLYQLYKYPVYLNDRVEVENYLLQAAAGKVPLPDAKKCAELARILGVPRKYRT